MKTAVALVLVALSALFLVLLLDIVASTQDESLRSKALDASRKMQAELAKPQSEREFGAALSAAIRKEDIALVEMLVAQSSIVGVRTSSKHWSTPLHVAVYKANDEILKVLLAHGADPNALDYEGFRPLRRAIESGNLSVMDILLDNGVSADGFTRELPWGGSGLPLTAAILSGSAEAVDLLLSKGADVNADPGVEMTPLHAACGRVDPVMVARMLEEGADVNRRHVQGGGTSLGLAAHGLHYPEKARAVAKLLLAEGADPNLSDDAGRTALHWSMIGPAVEMPRLLIDEGAEVDRIDRFGFTPYGYAAALGNEEMMTLLRESGARTEGVGFGDDYPLHRASVRWDTGEVRRLLEEGADATSVSENGWTPLHAAAFCVHGLRPEVTDLLLEHGADPNASGPHGWTPLHVASFLGRSRAVRDLLAVGGDPSVIDEDGNTARNLATTAGRFSEVGVLDRHAAAQSN